MMMAGRRVLKWLGVGAVYIGGVYGGMLYYQTANVGEITDEEREETWNHLAEDYDKEIEDTERSTGVMKQRQELMTSATGHVLEVGAGTARNIRFYPNTLSSLTLLDRSPSMIAKGRDRVNEYMAAKHAESSPIYAISGADSLDSERGAAHATMPSTIPVHFDAHPSEGLPYNDETFDTVVDTFGLCSYDNPQKALQEMFRVTKQGGKVLLLEHGISHTWPPVSLYLSWRAKCHAKHWGCWWDRDMREIVNGAVNKNNNGDGNHEHRLPSRLSVVEKRNYHLGTGYVFVIEKHVPK